MIRRVEKELDEGGLSKEIISEFVNISLASAKLKKIKIKQENGVFEMRGNMNIFIYGQIGGTKSTLLKEISNKTLCKKPFTDLTYPALIGSVDNMTRQLIIGASWECRNSLLLLDEFDFAKRNKDDIRALLQLIEGGSYNKKMASFSSPIEEIDNDLSYKFENGTFNIQTRFSLVIVTMKFPYTSQNMELQALVSRSVCLPWYPTRNDLMKLGQGFSLFKFKDKTIEKDEVTLSKKNYNYIYNYVFEQTEHPNALRIIGDCVRVFVIEGKHRKDLYDLIIKLGSKHFQSKAPKKKK
jgi:hypothetical protein